MVLGGLSALGFAIWFVVKLTQEYANKQEVAALESSMEERTRLMADLEEKRDEQLRLLAIDERALYISELEASVAEKRSELAELEEIRAGAEKHDIESWRAELGAGTGIVRASPQMVCPHCHARGSVLTANSISELTLARCTNCANSWKF